MYIVKLAMVCIILVTAFTNFLLYIRCYCRPTAWRTIADILSFALIFHMCFMMIGGNYGMLNLKNLCSFHTFQFSILCVYIHNHQKLGL